MASRRWRASTPMSCLSRGRCVSRELRKQCASDLQFHVCFVHAVQLHGGFRYHLLLASFSVRLSSMVHSLLRLPSLVERDNTWCHCVFIGLLTLYGTILEFDTILEDDLVNVSRTMRKLVKKGKEESSVFHTEISYVIWMWCTEH